MIVVGINACHGDASAVLLRDGHLVAAMGEERFRRIRHWAGFPRDSIRTCLAMAGVSPRRVDHLAISRNPRAHLGRKILFALRQRPGTRLLRVVYVMPVVCRTCPRH
jgi:carbamoyltransferase